MAVHARLFDMWEDDMDCTLEALFCSPPGVGPGGMLVPSFDAPPRPVTPLEVQQRAKATLNCGAFAAWMSQRCAIVTEGPRCLKQASSDAGYVSSDSGSGSGSGYLPVVAGCSAVQTAPHPACSQRASPPIQGEIAPSSCDRCSTAFCSPCGRDVALQGCASGSHALMQLQRIDAPASPAAHACTVQPESQPSGWLQLLAEMAPVSSSRVKQEPDSLLTCRPTADSYTPPRKRGRKPSGTATKPDRNRINAMKIQELEAELAENLKLARSLEKENEALRRKERLLQVVKDVCEDRQAAHLLQPRAVVDALHALLVVLLSGRTYKAAKQLVLILGNIQQLRDLTVDKLRAVWQAVLNELSACLVEGLQDVLCLLVKRAIDFNMAVALHAPALAIHLACINIFNGEEEHRDLRFWGAVADRMCLSLEQQHSMASALEALTAELADLARERTLLKQQLEDAVRGQSAAYNAIMLDACGEVLEATQRLQLNMARCDTLHSLTSSALLNMLTPAQVAQMCAHSSPKFPSITLISLSVAARLGVFAVPP